MDWTTVAVAVVTAAAGIASGLAAARFQAKNTERQLRTQVELLEREHEEASRTTRRSSYHEFLDADRAFQALALSAELIDRNRYAKWQERFDHAYNGLQLFGTPAVREKAMQFADVFPRQLKAQRRGDLDDAEWAKAYSDRVRDSYWRLFPQVRQRRAELIEAMRLDVARPG